MLVVIEKKVTKQDMDTFGDSKEIVYENKNTQSNNGRTNHILGQIQS